MKTKHCDTTKAQMHTLRFVNDLSSGGLWSGVLTDREEDFIKQA